MYEGKILLSDLDGTLLNEKKEISKENIDAITYFVENGGRFGVATGRDVENALNILKEVPINFYCIFSNGSVLFDKDKGEVLAENLLDKEKIIPFLERVVKEQPEIGIQAHTNEGTVLCPVKGHLDESYVSTHHPYGYKTLEELAECQVRKMLFITKDGDFSWLEKHSEPLTDVIQRVQSSKTFYEFLPAGSSKGSMVAEIRKLIPEHDVIYAVGDFYNDVEMVAEADVGIFCENAPDALKEDANFICASNNNHPIADIIRRVIPKKSK